MLIYYLLLIHIWNFFSVFFRKSNFWELRVFEKKGSVVGRSLGTLMFVWIIFT